MCKHRGIAHKLRALFSLWFAGVNTSIKSTKVKFVPIIKHIDIHV